MGIDIRDIHKAHDAHLMARARWAHGRRINEEEYNKDVSILVECVFQNQDIEPIRKKVILKHKEEVQKYAEFVESFETGNMPKSIKDYLKVFEDFDELYFLQERENEAIKKMMRDSSYI